MDRSPVYGVLVLRCSDCRATALCDLAVMHWNCRSRTTTTLSRLNMMDSILNASLFRCRIPAARDWSLSLVHGTGYNSVLMNAIYYAVNHGAKLINMSFNDSSSSQELAKRCELRQFDGHDFAGRQRAMRDGRRQSTLARSRM
jgi:hypothetical protein